MGVLSDPDGVGSPALDFVIACCRWPDDDSRRTLVVDRSADVEDWRQVPEFARAHRVEGMVADAIRRFDFDRPVEIDAWADAMRETMRAQALLEIGETLRVCDVLADLPFKVLKGAPLGVQAYGRTAIKRSWDVDILVDRGDALEAARRIASLGYAPSKPPRMLDAGELRRWSSVSKHASFASPDRLEVELHWRPTSLPGMLETVGAGDRSRTVKLLGDSAVPVLADDANLAYLCVHGTSHGWSRLKWLADLSALVSSWNDREIDGIVAAAMRLGTGEAVVASFLVRERLFGLAVPASVEVTDRARAIEALAVSVIAARRADRPIEADRTARTAIETIRRMMGRGRSYVPAYLLQRHRGTEIRALVALPKWLDWAYWLIRPYSWLRRLVASSRS